MLKILILYSHLMLNYGGNIMEVLIRNSYTINDFIVTNGIIRNSRELIMIFITSKHYKS